MSTTHPVPFSRPDGRAADHDHHHHDHHDHHHHHGERGRDGFRRARRSRYLAEVQMNDDPNDSAADDRRDARGSRSRGRRGGFGPDSARAFGPGFGPGFGPAFGPGGPGFGPRGGRRGGGRRGGRGGRGDVRAAILLLLESEPMHGYELIQQIQDKTGGLWVPSPGSIYPALQQLEDEGLVAFERVEGRKTASLTDAGTAYVEEHRAELGAPWDDVSGGVSGEARELRQLIGALMGAVHTVSHVGTKEQVSQASDVLVQARKSLYRILAEDEPTS